MPARTKHYNLNGLAGCVAQLRSRRTGALVSIYNAAQAGMDECVSEADPNGLPWVTLCEAHGNLVNHPTLELARGHAREPESWCEPCGDVIGRAVPGWYILRHSGRVPRDTGWRVLAGPFWEEPTERWRAVYLATRQGGIELVDPTGQVVREYGAPRLRTRW